MNRQYIEHVSVKDHSNLASGILNMQNEYLKDHTWVKIDHVVYEGEGLYVLILSVGEEYFTDDKLRETYYFVKERNSFYDLTVGPYEEKRLDWLIANGYIKGAKKTSADGNSTYTGLELSEELDF